MVTTLHFRSNFLRCLFLFHTTPYQIHCEVDHHLNNRHFLTSWEPPIMTVKTINGWHLTAFTILGTNFDDATPRVHNISSWHNPIFCNPLIFWKKDQNFHICLRSGPRWLTPPSPYGQPDRKISTFFYAPPKLPLTSGNLLKSILLYGEFVLFHYFKSCSI